MSVPRCEFHCQRGMLMIEVLVTILITTLGLLGIIALFAKSQVMSDEAYQRYQALDIAQQLGEVLSTNRTEAALNAASGYVITTTLAGDPLFLDSPSNANMAIQDLSRFHEALVGAQKISAGNKIAPLVSARGCVDFLGTVGDVTDPPRYRISVAWQGRQEIAVQSGEVLLGGSDCAKNLYGTGGDDVKRRRVVSIEVQVL